MRASGMAALLCSISILMSVPALADPILIGTGLDTSVTQGYVIGQTITIPLGYQFLAQGFTLDTRVYANRIDTVIAGDGSGPIPFMMQLTNALGPTATVLTTSEMEFLATRTWYSAIFSLPIEQYLDPGSYYLVLSSNSYGLNASYNFNNPPIQIPSDFGSLTGFYYTNFGDVNVSNPPASTWLGPSQYPLQAQLIGTIGAPIPEPPGLFLVSSGLAVLGFLRRSRRLKRSSRQN